MQKIDQSRTHGLIGTLIFHALLFLILIVSKFSTPLPLPGEEGIMINFGDNSPGAGISQRISTPPPKPKKQAPTPVKEKVEEKTLTQDFEESVSIDKKEDVKEKPKKKEPKPVEKEVKSEEIKENAEEETKEAEPVKEERQVNKKALFPGKKNKKGSDSGQGSSKGTGNEGSNTTGETESNSKGGTGLGNSGISFNLGGRSMQHMERPEYVKQEEGRVVVEVTVDRDGNVIQAVAGVKGSSTLDEYLLKVAKNAALKTKFNVKPNAPLQQKGTITYNFVLQ